MQKLILERDRFNEYEPLVNEGYTLWIFHYFLTDIQISSIPYYINWALDPTQISLGCSNKTEINKFNNSILINFLFSDEPDKGPIFKISITQFVNALKDWEKTVALNPKKIIIIEENGKIAIEQA